MTRNTVMVRKRSVDDGAEQAIAPRVAKRARFQMDDEDEVLSNTCEDGSPTLGSTPFSPQSLATTDVQSIAATSVTSRSSTKRPKKYICEHDGCGKAFDRPVRLQAHVRTHTDDRPFACEEDDCDKRFFKAEHLKAHVQNKHSNDANFVCEYVLSTSEEGVDIECGKAFTTASRLKRHVAAHEEKDDLRCHELGCGQVFRKMETLQRHIKKEHLNEPAYRCTKLITSPAAFTEDGEEEEEECGQNFTTISQLKTHEINAHFGVKYICEICSPPTSTTTDTITAEPVGFHTYAEYQSHLKHAHPPRCPVCNHPCASNRALTAHMEIEHSTLSSRQKFPCTYPDCDRGFTRKGNLNVHIQNVHVKSKRFICGEFSLVGNEKCVGWEESMGCGVSFGSKASLEGHVRTRHLGLESLYHPRKSRDKVKVKVEEGEEVSAMDVDHRSLDGGGKKDDTMALLTGHGYESSRLLACWNDGCPVRFMREYDLAQHMELTHGWNVDDINDRLAEDAALEGGQFWIGGVEEDVAILPGEEWSQLAGGTMDADGVRYDPHDGEVMGNEVYGDDGGMFLEEHAQMMDGDYDDVFDCASSCRFDAMIDPMLVSM